jgi:hypothetical protein
MARKKHTAEQIIVKLREAEVLQASGQSFLEVWRRIGVTEQTYYRWRKEFGGLRVDRAKRRRWPSFASFFPEVVERMKDLGQR